MSELVLSWGTLNFGSLQDDVLGESNASKHRDKLWYRSIGVYLECIARSQREHRLPCFVATGHFTPHLRYVPEEEMDYIVHLLNST